MATDIKIDPNTLDFVDDGQGGWIEVEDSSTAMLLQIDSEEGAWWGDVRAGSQNAAIMRASTQEPEQIQASLKRAAGALVQAGLISDLTVLIDAPHTGVGYAQFLIGWRDRTSGSPGELAYSPLGGHPQ